MSTQNKKFNYFGIVINAPKEKATTDQVNDFFNAVMTAIQNYNKIKFYASIIHDKDKLDNGEPKTPHCHIVIETYEKWTHLGALKEIANHLAINKDLISLEGSNNEYLLIQYLTHKNQPSKTQYDYEKIKTNNKEELELRYKNEYQDPEQELLKTLQECETITELAQKLGPTKANSLMRLFNAMKTEKDNSMFLQLQAYRRIAEKYDDLLRLMDDLLNTLQNGLKDSEKRLINLNDFISRFSRF